MRTGDVLGGGCRHGWQSEFAIEDVVGVIDPISSDLRDVPDLRGRAWEAVTATGCVGACGGDRFNRPSPKEVLVTRTSEERTVRKSAQA